MHLFSRLIPEARSGLFQIPNGGRSRWPWFRRNCEHEARSYSKAGDGLNGKQGGEAAVDGSL